jgi:hypothetical protein
VEVDNSPRRTAIVKPADQTDESMHAMGYRRVDTVWKNHEVHPYSEPDLPIETL